MSLILKVIRYSSSWRDPDRDLPSATPYCFVLQSSTQYKLPRIDYLIQHEIFPSYFNPISFRKLFQLLFLEHQKLVTMANCASHSMWLGFKEDDNGVVFDVNSNVAIYLASGNTDMWDTHSGTVQWKHCFPIGRNHLVQFDQWEFIIDQKTNKLIQN